MEEDNSFKDAFVDTLGFGIINFASGYTLVPLIFKETSDLKTKLIRLGISCSINLTSAIVYNKFLKRFKVLTGYSSFDKYLYSLGPGLYFNALLTGSKAAVFNDVIALTLLFLRDLYR